MATTKSKGSSSLGRDSQPKYLGVKLYAGEKTKPGMIIVRQRGSKIIPGKNVAKGSDDTLFALKEGIVAFKTINKKSFTGQKKLTKVVEIK